MKRLIVVLMVLAVSGVVVGSIWYLLAASGLPLLESEFDLRRFFTSRIEGERRERFPMLNLPNKSEIVFREPDLANYPSEAVGLFVAGMGCPTFLQTPREEDRAWRMRLLRLLWQDQDGPPSDDVCDVQLSRLITKSLHIGGGLSEILAIHRIRTMLPKGKLVAYVMATQEYSSGVIGLEWAAQALYHRPIQKMTLDELAQLTLALPPTNAYDDLLQCSELSTIRVARDAILARAANEALVSMEKAKTAAQQSVLCPR